MKTLLILLASATCFTPLFAQTRSQNPSEPVSGDTMVVVGDPENKPYYRRGYDFCVISEPLGSVDHPYKIGKYEVTVDDWITFLNAVASLPDINHQIDVHGLWNEEMLDWIQPWDGPMENGEYSRTYQIKDQLFEKLPITYVNFYSSLYYINWKEHGSPILEAGADVDALLKHGAYEFVKYDQVPKYGLTQNGILQNEKSRFYLPSQDEWVKAAYYNGNKVGGWYSMYPTQQDTPPGNNSGDVLNQANYNSRSWFSSPLLKLTPVDCFSESKSYYGCYDMGGNVNEWTYSSNSLDSDLDFLSNLLIVRGGSYESQYNYTEDNDLMIRAIPKHYYPTTESATIGFRIAERDEENRDSQNSIPLDIINRIKAHGVGWSSAETYDGYIAAKNIYYCCLPEKIIKNYKYKVPKFTSSQLEEIRNTGKFTILKPIYDEPLLDVKDVARGDDACFDSYYPQRKKNCWDSSDDKLRRMEPYCDSDNYTPKYEPYTRGSQITQAIHAGKNPGDTSMYSFELESRGPNFQKTFLVPIIEEHFLGVPLGVLEVSKQLLCGGIAGLAIGAACEYTGKYLGEGIGYLAGGTKGAALGEGIGEDVGVVMGMILPFAIFL